MNNGCNNIKKSNHYMFMLTLNDFVKMVSDDMKNLQRVNKVLCRRLFRL